MALSLFQALRWRGGRERKKHAKRWRAGKGKGKGRAPAQALPSFLPFIFVFALSQFSGPDDLGAWNWLNVEANRQ